MASYWQPAPDGWPAPQRLLCQSQSRAPHLRVLPPQSRQKRAFKPKPPTPNTSPSHRPQLLAVAPNLQRLIGSGSVTIHLVFNRPGLLYLAQSWTFTAGKIVGWPPAISFGKTSLVKEPLPRQALVDRVPPAGLLHHSDRGVNMPAAAYRALLHFRQIQTSIGGRGEKLLRQRAMESILEHPQNEMAPPEKLPNSPGGPFRHLRLYRHFYNPKTAPQRSGIIPLWTSTV